MGDFRDRLRRIRHEAGAEEERRAAEKAEETRRARETTPHVGFESHGARAGSVKLQSRPWPASLTLSP